MTFRISYTETSYRYDRDNYCVVDQHDVYNLEDETYQGLEKQIAELIENMSNRLSTKLLENHSHSLERYETKLNNPTYYGGDFIEGERTVIDFITPIYKVEYLENEKDTSDFNDEFEATTRRKTKLLVDKAKINLVKEAENAKLLKEAKEEQKKEADYQTYLLLKKKYEN